MQPPESRRAAGAWSRACRDLPSTSTVADTASAPRPGHAAYGAGRVRCFPGPGIVRALARRGRKQVAKLLDDRTPKVADTWDLGQGAEIDDSLVALALLGT